MNRCLALIKFALFVSLSCLAGPARALDPGPLIAPDQMWLSYDLSQGESFGWTYPEFDLNPSPAAWVSGRVLAATAVRPSITRSNLWAPQSGVTVFARLTPTLTHYFRTSFVLTNDTFAPALQVVHLLSDGAVFYLNGQEIGRWNMPDGPVSPTSQALPLPRPLDAHAFVASSAALVPGTNVLSVAVYSAPDAIPSAGTCFGARLNVIDQDHLFLTESLTNQVRFVGGSLHLSPNVASAWPYSAQWYFNGLPVTGPADTTLDIPSLAIGDSGTYALVLSNGLGRSVTNTFALTLLSASIQGSWDPSFVSASVGPVVRACVVLPDDKIVVGGTFGPVTRLNPDGTPDPTFHPPAGLVGVYSLLSLPDRSLIVGGNYTVKVGTNTIVGVMRLFEDGTPDTNFVVQTDGGRVLNMGMAPDGKIYLAGEFSVVNRKTMIGFARLNQNGTLDTNFLPKLPYVGGRALLVQPDGKVIVSHGFPDPKKSTNLLSRVNPDGSVDPTFVPPMGLLPGTTYSEFVGALAMDDDLNLYAGGWFRTYGPVIRTNVVRIKPNGEIDPTFDAGIGQNMFAYNLVPLTDGGVLFLSDLSHFNHFLIGGVAKLRHDGSVDTGFLLSTAMFDPIIPPGEPGNPGPPSIYGVGFQRDGRMILAGNFQSYLGNKLSNVVRVFMPLPSPRLRLDRSSDEEFLVSWPVAGGDGEIQSTSQPAVGGWSSVTAEAKKSGGRWFLPQSSSPSGARFYRHVR